jgi:hypothetical protein
VFAVVRLADELATGNSETLKYNVMYSRGQIQSP